MDYVGNFVYVDNQLKRILTENGYIENGQYYYNVADHLGNVRILADASGVKKQSTVYYPYGLQTGESTGSEVQPYKYSGKEYDQLHGLNLYDFSARFYDPSLGRFMTMDPLAEKYYGWSPYAYCANNPLRFIDPKGKDIWDFIGGIVHSVGSNLTLGAIPINTSLVSDVSDYKAGRTVGDVVSIVMGAAETIVGGGATLGGSVVIAGTAGVGSLVAVPVSTTGVGMVVHGTGVMETAIKSLATQEGKGTSKGSEKSNTSSGNKNTSHANQKAKESAGQKYTEIKSQYDKLNSKPNKTPADKKELKKLENQIDHWKRKQDFSGENHSRNAKGN